MIFKNSRLKQNKTKQNKQKIKNKTNKIQTNKQTKNKTKQTKKKQTNKQKQNKIKHPINHATQLEDLHKYFFFSTTKRLDSTSLGIFKNNITDLTLRTSLQMFPMHC